MRSQHEIQNEARSLLGQIGQNRALYLNQEEQLRGRLAALDSEIAALNEAEAKKTPETLRMELDDVKTKLAALIAANDTKETA